MERNFYTDDFERLIRQKADQYKMYPSDQVWKGINRSLHGRKRWRWAGLAVLLLGVGLYTTNRYVIDHAANRLANNMQPSIDAASNTNTSSNQSDNNNNIASTAGTQISRTQTTSGNNTISNSATSNTTGNSIINDQLSFSNEQPLLIYHSDPSDITAYDMPEVDMSNAKEQSKESVITTDASIADAASESVKKQKGINWLEDYAMFQLQSSKPKRMGVQLYFSPTVNYRKLKGSSYFPTSEIENVPLKLNVLGDVDQYVKHKPALGFEVGGNILYRTSKLITFKAGLQFNYSRYNIEAYSAPTEIATIALNNSLPMVRDTITQYSNIRNLSGFAQQDLSNQYFQLSLPVGVELRVLGNDKLQLNVAGTIQPTYLLNRNTYLITTDYKNYMREPSLVRRWNLNTAVETYVSYNTGTVRWQVGPQFRYQVLSSYSRKYPIKEQLMEYGFKIGVSKTIR